jgi:hypothetical protein
MKDMFESVRPDKNFNLETLSYQEIFEGLKFGIAKAISRMTKEEVDAEDLELKRERCNTKRIFAKDMNLYPKIYLDLVGEFSVLISPFEIELMQIEYRIKTYSCEELRESLFNFMCSKFPDSGYEKCYDKYFKNVEMIERQREKHLCI